MTTGKQKKKNVLYASIIAPNNLFTTEPNGGIKKSPCPVLLSVFEYLYRVKGHLTVDRFSTGVGKVPTWSVVKKDPFFRPAQI